MINIPVFIVDKDSAGALTGRRDWGTLLGHDCQDAQWKNGSYISVNTGARIGSGSLVTVHKSSRADCDEWAYRKAWLLNENCWVLVVSASPGGQSQFSEDARYYERREPIADIGVDRVLQRCFKRFRRQLERSSVAQWELLEPDEECIFLQAVAFFLMAREEGIMLKSTKLSERFWSGLASDWQRAVGSREMPTGLDDFDLVTLRKSLRVGHGNAASYKIRGLRHDWLKRQIIEKSEGDIVYLWRKGPWKALVDEFPRRIKTLRTLNFDLASGALREIERVTKSVEDLDRDTRTLIVQAVHGRYLKTFENTKLADRIRSSTENLAKGLSYLALVWLHDPDGPEENVITAWRSLKNEALKVYSLLGELPNSFLDVV